MKIMGIIAIAMLTAALLFVACNDNSTGLLTGSHDAQLARATVDYQVRVTSRTGNGPEIVQMVEPAIWDGKSDLTKGGFYHWGSHAEAMAAYKDCDPEMYQDIKQIAERLAGGIAGSKVKETGATQLASTPSPYCLVVPTGGSTYAMAQVDDPGNPVYPYQSRIRLLLSYPPPYDSLHTMDSTWYDGQSRFKSVSTTKECPVELGANARSWWYGDTTAYWHAEDQDGCD